MKNLALIATAAALGLFAASSLHAQDTATTSTTTTKTTRRTNVSRTTTATVTARNNARLNARLRANQNANVTTTTAPRLDGGVVRAARSNSPLQAVNPFAPAEYGSGEQVTRHDPDDPFQRAQGLKLVTVEF